MNAPEQRTSVLASLAEGLRVFAGDIVGGCFAIAHRSLAVLGVVVAAAVVLMATQPDLRQQTETRLSAWLTRQKTAQTPVKTEQAAVARATAADPQALPPEQAQLAQWIARKYQVAPEPVAALVNGAYQTGKTTRIDPALILAVMAIESSFNPFAQSTAGAPGLMQVMTRVHVEKYNGYGGQFAAFDPLSNLRVGAWVLRDCIDQAGSTEGGLRCYVGAANLKTDGGYVNKVLAEYGRLQQVIAPFHPESASRPVSMAMTAPPQPKQPVAAKTRPRSAPQPSLVVVASAKTNG
jgi:soluble lytic murein transglycosylase-like protein